MGTEETKPIFSLKPKNVTNQPVNVEPKLLPKTTHIDEAKLIKPALIKPMLATITAPDDCTKVVISKPAIKPRGLVDVQRFNKCRSEERRVGKECKYRG